MVSAEVWTATAAATSLLAMVVAIAFFSQRTNRDIPGRLNGLHPFTWHGIGEMYEGEWADGKQHGLGVQWSKSGLMLACGRWENGRHLELRPVPRTKITIGKHLPAAARAADPSRTLLLPSYKHYIGEFDEDFRPHGEGSEFAADGTETASGQWRDGKLHGRGKMAFSDGSRYEGEFVDGQYSGLGVFTSGEDGDVYEGEWADNRRSGLGVQWDKDGNVIGCGLWSDNELVDSRSVPRSKLPTGVHLSTAAKLADLICPGGGFYCGAVDLNHQPHGSGTLYRADGSEAAHGDWAGGRLWVSGARDAQGRLQCAGREWSALGLFEGEFVDGLRSGLGVLTLMDNQLFEGE